MESKKRKKEYGTNIGVVEYDEKDEQKEAIPVVQ